VKGRYSLTLRGRPKLFPKSPLGVLSNPPSKLIVASACHAHIMPDLEYRGETMPVDDAAAGPTAIAPPRPPLGRSLPAQDVLLRSQSRATSARALAAAPTAVRVVL
jgi:hypothetical protein